MPKKPRVFLDAGTGYPYPKHLHDLAKRHSNIKFTAVDWQQEEHLFAGLREHSKKQIEIFEKQLKENPENEQAKKELKKFKALLKILASEKEVNSKLVEFKKKNLLSELHERKDNSVDFLNSDFILDPDTGFITVSQTVRSSYFFAAATSLLRKKISKRQQNIGKTGWKGGNHESL